MRQQNYTMTSYAKSNQDFDSRIERDAILKQWSASEQFIRDAIRKTLYYRNEKLYIPDTVIDFYETSGTYVTLKYT